ncbi:acVLRF1 family peptidyl-tRNA hydrolase [Ornithinimicrobium sp. Y1694]|uniref:acVLRF1 family peptidyl-tRNA hydrolase n=1 Tax=Ornithinimicrobium sp. Y1694 TaxID=3418590 RepID=UPI003CF408BB
MSAVRTVEVAPERLAGWIERFTSSHGDVTRSIDRGTSPSSYLLTAADGSWARLTGWWDAREEDALEQGGWLTGEWACPPPLFVVLVRRGGYAVAVTSRDVRLLAHKVGTRHVQSRTAAGGWSQQRYARRRANQADELVEAVVAHAVRVLAEGEEQLRATVGGLVLGGDRSLAAQVLEAVGSSAVGSSSVGSRAVGSSAVARGARSRLHGIPRREFWDVADPRRSVLDETVRRGSAVRVEVWNA